MYAYHSTIHSSTQVSPFRLKFGRHPQFNSFPGHEVSDPTSYQKELQLKLAKLQDMVETNIVQSANYQKTGYDHCTQVRTFAVNNPVWLLIPRQGKLGSKWQGGWKVRGVKSEVTIQISNEKDHCKVVHVNRLQHRIQPSDTGTCVPTHNATRIWHPPQTDHTVIWEDTDLPTVSQSNSNILQRRYPLRNGQPPEHLQL